MDERALPEKADQHRHILFVLEYFPPHVGGGETLFGNLTKALVSQGHRVSVITLWVPGTRQRETFDGVEILRVKTPQVARRYLFMIFALPVVLRWARRADLIHTTTYNAGIMGWFAARLWRKPVVLTVHEVFGAQWNSLLGMNRLVGYAFRAYEWSLLHLPFTHYICDSGFTRMRLLALNDLPAARTSVVYPAVDYGFWDQRLHRRRALHDELGLAAGTFIYLYFGRVGISKGVEYLVEAARQVHEEVPMSHLVLILARDPLTPYRRILERIQRLGLSEHVTVLDPVPWADLPGYLLGADCVVIPSVSEGFGYSAVEAATLGCAVVATSEHSVEEVIPESATFVPPRDPHALAEAILSIARTTPQWHPPGRFDIASHTDGVIRVYDGLRTSACSGEPQGYSKAD